MRLREHGAMVNQAAAEVPPHSRVDQVGRRCSNSRSPILLPRVLCRVLGGILPALLLDFLGVAKDTELVEGVFAIAAFAVAYGCAVWVTQKPKMCRKCGCVSARLQE